MSIAPIKNLTKAEETIFTAFDGNKAMLNGPVGKREAAIAALKQNGLPTRRVEAWHYTDLRATLPDVPSPLVGNAESNVVPFVADQDLFSGSAFDPERIDFSFRGSDDTIGQINAAFATDGMQAVIKAGEDVADTLEFQNIINDGAGHRRHTIEVQEKATVTFVQRELGTDGFGTTVTNLDIADGANVTYVIAQQTSEASTHLGQINVNVGAGAQFMLFVLNAGGKLVRLEVNVKMVGEESDFQLRGVNLIGDDQHIDLTMDLTHAVPNTTSEEVIRNVVTGKGKGVFQGRIAVAQIAQKTDAQMACNTLLLSDDGDFSSKPELEIFADDVACGHGATFTDLEPSYLFYLMSRGIPEKEARSLLIKGFVDEIVEDLENEKLEDAIVQVIDGWLDDNG